jgi:hypothetical protein
VRLSTVTFGSGSRLLRIQDCAFYRCYVLSSLCIPARVNMLCESCFYGCEFVSTFTFEAGSRLSRIDDSAVSRCSLLV